MKKCLSWPISDLMMKFLAGVSVMGRLTLLLNILSLGHELAKNKPQLFSNIFLPLQPATPLGTVGYLYG